MADLRQETIARHARAPQSRALSLSVPTSVLGLSQAEHSADLPREGDSKRFLDDFYVAAVEPARLPDALRSLADLLAADEAVLFAHNGRSQADAHSILSRAGRQYYADERGSIMECELAALLARRPATGAEVWATQRDPAAPGAENCLIVAPNLDGKSSTGLALSRSGKPFADYDRARVLALLPDIRRALELRLRVGRADTLDLGAQLFDRNPIAILVTRHKSIEQSNAAALALLPDRRPISLAGNKLWFEDSRASAAFELISRAGPDAAVAQSFAFVVEGVAGRTWIVQFSKQRTSPIKDDAGTAVVVALTPFNAASKTRETMLNGFQDLTPAERTIFAAFVDGHDIAAIAARLNRSVETVRWHVRNLFTKLGVNSQADLARLGALLLPI